MSYSQQDMAGAQPPMEQPMPAAPPAGGEMPPGEASPQDVMAAQDEQRMAQIQAIAASAPQPEKPYTVKAVDRMLAAMNDFITTVDEEIMPIEYAAPEGNKIEGPLPAEVFVPYVVTMSFIEQLGEYEKYIIQPDSLVSDTALKKSEANFKRMKKDKSLVEDMQAAAQGAPLAEDDDPMSDAEMAEMETGRPPGDFDQEDEDIMGMM